MSSTIHCPFDGIRVLDATHVLAGPFCTYQLALLGADVIKIESPRMPDCTRGRGPDDQLNAAGLGMNYLVQGANKRSVTLDLATMQGKALFLELANTADVVVENFRAGAFAALGLGPEVLQARNPELIYCAITGFGQGGARGAVNAYDNVIQAASGIMAGTRAASGEAVKTGASLVDYATGYSAAFAIAAALLQRATTHRGQIIDCSMFETALTLMAPEAAAALYEGPTEARPKEAGLGTYETADGLLMLGAFNPRQNRRLWNALERSGFAGPERSDFAGPERSDFAGPERSDFAGPERSDFAGPERSGFAGLQSWQDLWHQAGAMRASLAQILRTKPAAEWETYFHAIGVPAERVRPLEEAVQMPHLRDRPFFQDIHPLGAAAASVTVPLAPFTFAEGGPAINRPPPRAGEHNAEILQTLGLSEAAIADLRARKVIS